MQGSDAGKGDRRRRPQITREEEERRYAMAGLGPRPVKVWSAEIIADKNYPAGFPIPITVTPAAPDDKMALVKDGKVVGGIVNLATGAVYFRPSPGCKVKLVRLTKSQLALAPQLTEEDCRVIYGCSRRTLLRRLGKARGQAVAVNDLIENKTRKGRR